MGNGRNQSVSIAESRSEERTAPAKEFPDRDALADAAYRSRLVPPILGPRGDAVAHLFWEVHALRTTMEEINPYQSPKAKQKKEPQESIRFSTWMLLLKDLCVFAVISVIIIVVLIALSWRN
ncbi:MAG: hypothetical protein N2C14_17940 [Planctomycetales bacterium]